MDAVRKTYQRAVCIPLNSVESIWQEYNQFENGINKMTVRPLSLLRCCVPLFASGIHAAVHLIPSRVVRAT